MFVSEKELSCDCSFIVLTNVITIVNYDHTVIMTINCNRKTFLAQATAILMMMSQNISLFFRTRSVLGESSE